MNIPFNILLSQSPEKIDLIDSFVRESNSYKSFVSPDNYSQAMGYFIKQPWNKIADLLNNNPTTLKQRLLSIYKWRNRIVHEADIKPVLAGIKFWPIRREDVLCAIDDIENIGLASISLLRNQEM